MESKKINQLATELTPALSDLTIIGDPTTGISKKITLSQMASLFTGTVEEYPDVASFPLVGVADTIYIALDTNVLYRWDTTLTSYVELSPNIINSLVFNDANGFDGTISLVGSVATLTITTALTTGSVAFIGASGALTQDNSNFYWDNSNKRLGINTNAPTTAIDVFGSGIIGRLNGTSTNNSFLGFASAGTNKWSIGNVQSDHRFRIYSEANTAELVSVLQTGEFGIGIANPTTKLHIDGGASALIANLDANVSVAKSISFRSDNSNRINLEVSGTESGSNAGADLFVRTYTDAGALLNTPLYIKRSTSFIGLGTVAPSAKLDVFNGDIALGSKGEVEIASNIGTLGFWTNDANVGLKSVASIYVENDGPDYWGGGTTNWSTRMKLRVLSQNSYIDAITILNSGFVGIGTLEPGQTLEVKSADGQGIRLKNAGSSDKRWDLVGSGNDLRINETGVGAALTVKAGGNIGIATTNPRGKLHVFSNTSTTTETTAFMVGSDTNNEMILSIGVNNTNLYTYIQSTRWNIAFSNLILNPNGGNVGIGGTTTNARLDVRAAGTSAFSYYFRNANGGYGGGIYNTGANNSSLYLANSSGTETILIGSNGGSYFNGGGNILIGTTTDAGTGILQVNGRAIAQSYNTVKGNTGSIANSTWTNMFTVSNIGMYLVNARLNAGAGDATNYTAFATVLYDGSASRIVTNNGGILQTRLSGNTVQVFQSSGATQGSGVTWAYTLVGAND